MATDTSAIDLAGLIEREAGVRFGKRQGKNDPTVKGGPCPFCGQGTDRFAVFVADQPQHYLCGIHGNGCGAHGDAITFIREYHDYGYFEACEHLGIDPSKEYENHGPRKEREDVAPVELWQTVGMVLCQAARNLLWSEDSAARAALQYLRHSRGLTDATIKHFGLGYNPVNKWIDPQEWGLTLEEGKKLWLPRGIVIPWRVNGQLWAINIRRGDKDVQADVARQVAKGVKKPVKRKYVVVSGSSQGLYNHDFIQPGAPLVLAEGEFDVMIVWQELAGKVSVVGTGGASKAHGDQWLQAIAAAGVKIWAGDVDDNNAGQDAAKRWQRKAGGVWVSAWAHDMTDMKLAGMDLQAWYDVALAMAASQAEHAPVVADPPAAVAPVVDPLMPSTKEYQADQLTALADRCCVCGLHIEAASNGQLSEEERARLAEIEFFYGDEGQLWCQDHYPPLLASQAPAVVDSTKDEFIAQAVHIVHSAFGPKSKFEIHIDPPGYTLAEHVKVLAEAEKERVKAAMAAYRKAQNDAVLGRA